MPLSRIDQVLAVLKMDFAELARIVAQASPAQQEMTLEQERAVVRDPKLLLTAISALTALFAATIALRQWDIKKVLAYSTVSQLGLMFVACGKYQEIGNGLYNGLYKGR